MSNVWGLDSSVRHIPKYVGEIWYVSKETGDNDNSGTSPDDSFETIGTAITACTAGDAIAIRAGTYTEESLNVNKDYVELWFEIGAVLDPAANTALTLSGNFCKIKGEHKITPGAGETGLLITGNECVIGQTKVIAGDIGISITGSGIILNDCAVGFPTDTAYDIQGTQARLFRCKTVGNAATYGYKISNGVDTGVLQECTCVGHGTSSYFIDTGSKDWTLLSCSSGAGDGRWRDVDSANVWSNFTYDEHVTKEITFAGGGVTTHNIFKVTGAVRVSDIHGHVGTVIPGVASTVYLQLYSTGGTVDITDAPGVNINAAVVGAVLVRNGPSTNALDLANPDGTPAVNENANWRDPKTFIDVVKDDSADTYIRLVMSAAQATGEIHWHCAWQPLTETGFLEPV